MRKSLVAVALAFAFPAAYAQSSVTVYGILDTGFEYVDAGSDTTFRLQGSGMSAGNRFGIRGSENLGGGYSAIFTLEGRFSLDTGSVTYNESIFNCRLSGSTAAAVCPGIRIVPGTAIATLPPTSPTYQAVLGGMNAVNQAILQGNTTVNGAGALFDRQSFLGVITPYGAVLAGRMYTPGYEILNKFNVMGDATALSFGQGYSIPAIRMNNALQYRAELKGFTASLFYSFGGSELLRNERTSAPTDGDDMYGAQLQYNTSNWGVGAGYNQNKVVPYATQVAGQPESKDGLETINFGAWVGFGNFKVYGQYMKRKNDNPLLTPLDIQNLVVSTGGNTAAITAALGGVQFQQFDVDAMRGLAGPIDASAYHLGVSWAFSPSSTLYGVFNYAKDEARSAWATQDAEVDHFGIGYQYMFSPRTAFYAVAAMMKNTDQGRLSPSSAGYTTGFATNFGEDTAAYQLGIRHSF
jgi:predicted porin